MTNFPIVTNDISSRIYTIRDVQVMLDEDLAILYKSSTMRLNQSVKRNIERFPETFCFRLTKLEYSNLISQIVISSLRSQFVTLNYGGRRKLPYVFTEQGVAMLSAVLKSDVAIHMSIQIMTAFVSMRRTIQSNILVSSRLDNLEHKQLETDVILIDKYVDDTVLNLFSKRRKGVGVTIYTQSHNSLDLYKFNQQYEEIIVKELKNTHDRFLIIDNSVIYHFGASIKDLGKKLFAVSKLGNDSLLLLQKFSHS